MVINTLLTSPRGLFAICVSLASLLLGGAYFVYLNLDSFPPDVLRLVPLIWLFGAIYGLILGSQAVAANDGRYLGIVSLLLSVPSILLAAVFTLGAMMGD